MVRKIYLHDGEKKIVVVVKTSIGKVRWAAAAIKTPGQFLMTPISVEKVKSSTLLENFTYWICKLKRKVLKQQRKKRN